MLRQNPPKPVELYLEESEDYPPRSFWDLVHSVCASGTVEEWPLDVSHGNERPSYSDALRGEEEKEWNLAIKS